MVDNDFMSFVSLEFLPMCVGVIASILFRQEVLVHLLSVSL